MRSLLLIVLLVLAHGVRAGDATSVTIALSVNLEPAYDVSVSERDKAACTPSYRDERRSSREICNDYQIDLEEDDDHVHVTVKPI